MKLFGRRSVFNSSPNAFSIKTEQGAAPNMLGVHVLRGFRAFFSPILSVSLRSCAERSEALPIPGKNRVFQSLANRKDRVLRSCQLILRNKQTGLARTEAEAQAKPPGETAETKRTQRCT